MNVFAKFDEIPSMILGVIKETKRYGRYGHTVGRSDNVKTVYPPTNTVCGGYKLVLRKIGITAGISRYKNETNTNDRQWVFVMCDVLPYCLAHKLIHYACYCLNCQDSV